MIFALASIGFMTILCVLAAALHARRLRKAESICCIAQGSWAFTFGAVSPLAYPPSWATATMFLVCTTIGIIIICKGMRMLVHCLRSAY